MALVCGCEIRAGQPITPETVREHYKHTISVMLFWELLQRPGTPPSDATMDLGRLRIEYQEAIEKLYPEAKID